MGSGDWSDAENDAVVAAYFAMLGDELADRKFRKVDVNRQVQQLTGRTEGSVGRKFSNVSAAARGLGLPVVSGYSPLQHLQSSLVDAIVRWLDLHPTWEASLVQKSHTGMSEDKRLTMTVPPTLQNAPPPKETEELMKVAMKHDVAGRDERNRALGERGEEFVFIYEQSTLFNKGRSDLAKRVRWTSKEDGDGAGYDIFSFTPEGRDRLIEVKTTNGWERTPFHISRNELDVADRRRENWCLFRLYDFARDPKAFELRPPLQAHVALTPTSFQASFG